MIFGLQARASLDLQTVGFVTIFAGLISASLAKLLRPLLARYALARPNARSSHRTPTPQGGGVAVLGGTLLATAAIWLFAPPVSPGTLAAVIAAVITIAAVGAVDDVCPIQPFPRLILQACAVIAVVATLPTGFRIIWFFPETLDRIAMVIGVLWLVNLVNFMDGIDLITVAEVAPITGTLVIFGCVGDLPVDATLIAAALCGAILGFAPFNKPVASLFLGDVGSLPIGLLLGWLLLLLAGRHLTAALLLPLYYVSDATLTLLLRLLRGERVTQAHRSHFYQQAVDAGMSVYQVVGRILAVNLALATLAFATLNATASMQALALLCGTGLVAGLIIKFAKAKARLAH